MSAAEFKDIESLRRRTGRTRSQFIRDAVATLKHGPVRTLTVTEDQADYGTPPASDIPDITDLAERRRRAIAAAGKFRSGITDLSADHDRYVEEAFADLRAKKTKG
jgi:hypothetical protein